MDIKIERKKILIVDDDQDFLRALALHLKGKGYETVAATDGVTAISVALEQKPDLILLDIGLPAGDGFTVLSAGVLGGHDVKTCNYRLLYGPCRLAAARA